MYIAAQKSQIMKKLTLIVFLSFSAILLFSNEGKSNDKKIEIEFNLKIDGKEITLRGHSVRVFTPSSVFTRTYILTQKLTESELELIRSNLGYYANYVIEILGTIADTGEELIGVGFLNKAGKLTVTFHSNGAGTTFPNGW